MLLLRYDNPDELNVIVILSGFELKFDVFIEPNDVEPYPVKLAELEANVDSVNPLACISKSVVDTSILPVNFNIAEVIVYPLRDDVSNTGVPLYTYFISPPVTCPIDKVLPLFVPT
jgi:hypothetical protein